MYYIYLLRYSDGDFYVGSARDLRDRFAKHEAAGAPAKSPQSSGDYLRLFNTYCSTAVAKPSSSDEVVE
jgi:predicted GIY-YIG superfamily endonuclease